MDIEGHEHDYRHIDMMKDMTMDNGHMTVMSQHHDKKDKESSHKPTKYIADTT